jgi:hypothetical protein
MKSFKQVVNMVVELVREEIGLQTKNARVESVMYDGWSKNSIHYIGIIAIYRYMKSYVVRELGLVTENSEERDVLLSVAPSNANPSWLAHNI